jgi:hypothetical protein
VPVCRFCGIKSKRIERVGRHGEDVQCQSVIRCFNRIFNQLEKLREAAYKIHRARKGGTLSSADLDYLEEVHREK